MMLGSFKVAQSTSGVNTIGSDPGERFVKAISLSRSNRITLPQCAQLVSMFAFRYLFLNRPCTKGVASASSPQAPYSRSPESKVMRCGVSSAVTG